MSHHQIEYRGVLLFLSIDPRLNFTGGLGGGGVLNGYSVRTIIRKLFATGIIKVHNKITHAYTVSSSYRYNAGKSSRNVICEFEPYFRKGTRKTKVDSVRYFADDFILTQPVMTVIIIRDASVRQQLTGLIKIKFYFKKCCYLLQRYIHTVNYSDCGPTYF